jgi:hypothetical protein
VDDRFGIGEGHEVREQCGDSEENEGSDVRTFLLSEPPALSRTNMEISHQRSDRHRGANGERKSRDAKIESKH